MSAETGKEQLAKWDVHNIKKKLKNIVFNLKINEMILMVEINKTKN